MPRRDSREKQEEEENMRFMRDQAAQLMMFFPQILQLHQDLFTCFATSMITAANNAPFAGAVAAGRGRAAAAGRGRGGRAVAAGRGRGGRAGRAGLGKGRAREPATTEEEHETESDGSVGSMRRKVRRHERRHDDDRRDDGYNSGPDIGGSSPAA